jgi:hypothetical protein
MNDTEHVFPLSELEQHKLDEVKEEIVHPVSRRMRRALGRNAWLAMAISMAAGVACGLAWGRRG